MPVSQTRSVTQNTAPVAQAKAQADAPAWQHALASAQSAPQPNSTAGPDGASARAAASQPGAQDTSQAAPPAAPSPPGGKAAGQTGKPKAAAASAPLTPAIATKDDKKGSAQANSAAALTMPVQPAAAMPATGARVKPHAANSQSADHVEAAASGQKTVPPQATASAPAPETAPPSDALGLCASGAADGSGGAPARALQNSKPAAQADSPAITAAQQSASPQIDAAATARNTPPAGTQPAARTAQTTPQHGDAVTPPSSLATPPAASSTAQVLTARAAQMPQAYAGMSASKGKDSTQPVSALGGIAASAATAPATGTDNSATVVPARAAAGTGSVATSPAALAATVTALHQSGQAGTVLRLDPPGLGHLSVQVGLGAQGQVNVLFVPSTADAAQAIHASLPGLGSAMAQSGLTLGQAQVGGQFFQQGGQDRHGGYTAPRRGNASASPAKTQTTTGGLSAYA
ncbi:MAG TPA: flagellar hook-length control protein FliK [Acidocella sp.]|nr:flagellar hook-length control protein FliK [Acidocella sp.]